MGIKKIWKINFQYFYKNLIIIQVYSFAIFFSKKMKRHLIEPEIEDILSVIKLYGCVPENALKYDENAIQNGLKKQLKSIIIYPQQIPKLKAEIKLQFMKSINAAGDNVGTFSATSLGEPLSQSCLNTFHSTGNSNIQMQTGLPRFKALLDLNRVNENNYMSIYFSDSYATRDIAELWPIAYKLFEYKILKDFVKNSFIKHNTIGLSIESFYSNSPWKAAEYYIVIELDFDMLFKYRTTPFELKKLIEENFADISAIYYDEKLFITALSLNDLVSVQQVADKFNKIAKNNYLLDLSQFWLNDENKNYYFYRDIVLKNILNFHVSGVQNIEQIFWAKSTLHDYSCDWVINTKGINLREILTLKEVNSHLTQSSNLWEIYEIFGIEACRAFLYEEFTKAFSSYLNPVHILLLVDAMCFNGRPIPVTRYGIDRANTNCIAKASFEQSLDNFLIAAQNGEIDDLSNISSCVILGKNIQTGTGYFDLVIQANTKKEQNNNNENDDEIFCAL